MNSTWRKAKMVLGFDLSNTNVSTTTGEENSHSDADNSAAALLPTNDVGLNSATPESGNSNAFKPPSHHLSSSPDLKVVRSSSRPSSNSKECAICLSTMKAGRGHALFTAECSHTFHFHCIASNVKHGNRLCPVCRAKWKEVPFPSTPSPEVAPPARDNRVNPIDWYNEGHAVFPPSMIPRASSHSRLQRNAAISFQASAEPNTFDDDEHLSGQPQAIQTNQHGSEKVVTCTTYPEFSDVERSATVESFAILVHLKAPVKDASPESRINVPLGSPPSGACRAPIDLVTVLDVSGSMSGTKLVLLKRAMGFVIQNLAPSDRLSVVAFSSAARRLFPLRCMSETGKLFALQAVNALVCSGGTNILEGLKKGAKAIEDRRERNPVCSIILLSDGQDTYTLPSSGFHRHQPDYTTLLPSSIRSGMGHRVPVHAFGFGSDHDAAALHAISEASGGTFSFIEAENVMQDAFAQCIGGLLSVVVQELYVGLDCVHPSVKIGGISSGSYSNYITANKGKGFIDVGDLYADEERDFLISVNVPPVSEAIDETLLLKVKCSYRDFISKEDVNSEEREVKIKRVEVVSNQTVCMEVDSQRNRLRGAEAMAEARTAAERGSLSEAVSVLGRYREALAGSPSSLSGIRLCGTLDAEVREMQDRMTSRQRYEESGRAYVLSGMSSHSLQRATVRGDSTDSGSAVHSYLTPSMEDMLLHSQSSYHSSPSPLRPPPSRGK